MHLSRATLDPSRPHKSMADLLVVGSVALDSVETPFGKVHEPLGGRGGMKEGRGLVGLATMNFWIQGKGDGLRRVLAEVDVVTINDGEARQLAGEPNLIRAARAIAAMGPQTVVVKRGEYGALLVTDGAFFFVPAYPLESVYDPTGAGDTFAGGFMGSPPAQEPLDARAMRRAPVSRSPVSSFTPRSF